MVEKSAESDVPPEWIGHLIHNSFYDKLVVIGFPYDEGATKSGARLGADLGPDSFRRFVKDIGSVQNPEYGVDISKALPKISDYGNIQIQDELAADQRTVIKPTMKQLYAKLATKVGLCIKRSNIPCIIGGSRDLFQAVSDAYLAHQSTEEGANDLVTFVSLTHTLDVAPMLETELCNQVSRKRYLLERMKPNFQVVEFGVDGARVPKSQLQYFESKTKGVGAGKDDHCSASRIVWMQQIRKQGFSAAWDELVTSLKGGAKTQTHMVHLSINMESIEGVVGVSTNCLSGGFSTQEAITICYDAGLKLASTDIVRSIDICEYNPYVEDWRTGRLVATLFYYFTLGLSQGLQSRKETSEKP